MNPTVYAITIDCADAAKLADFWAELLGRKVEPDATADFASLPGDGPASPKWLFIKVPEPKGGKNRVHVDLASSDRAAAVKQAVALGATEGREFDEDGAKWTTLTDPEGNEFDIAAL